MEKFDLSTISSATFNVTDGCGDIKVVRAIRAELLYEIIKAHTLVLEDPHCEVTDLIDLFTGFVASPYDVTWFTTHDTKEPVQKAIMQAAREGNDVVVIEILPMMDPDLGGIVLDK